MSKARQTTSKDTQPQQGKKVGISGEQLRKITIVAMIAILAFSIPATIIGLRNVTAKQKATFRYTGNVEQDSVYAIDIPAQDEAYRVKETHRHGETGKFKYFCNDTLIL